MIKFLDLQAQYRSLKPEIDSAIQSVLENARFIGGEAVRQFETSFSDYQGARHAIGVGNGTDALEIAIEALGLEKGSEIIVPANTFVASSEAVTRSGHKVVFADVCPDSFTLDPARVEDAITSKTSAIMAVHLYGQPCDMRSLKEVARRRGLRLIEDCAQAHGSEFENQRVGAIGDVGAFSFYPGKNLGAYGDAGAIVTNDADLALRCRKIANHGRIAKYNHEIEGRNSRLDELQATVLGVKLRHLDAWTEHRRQVSHWYSKYLADLSGIVLTPQVHAERRHVFHLYVVRVENRDQLERHLMALNIEFGIHYPIALPKLAPYRSTQSVKSCPIACTLDSKILSLPMGEHLSEGDVVAVCRGLSSFYGK